jgi:hypothetical protein
MIGGQRQQDSKTQRSSTETVESAAGTLEGVDDVKGSDSLALSVLSVGDRVTDDLKAE